MASVTGVIEGIEAIGKLESALTGFIDGLGSTIELNVSNGTSKQHRNPTKNGLPYLMCASDEIKMWEGDHWVKDEPKGSEEIFLEPPTSTEKIKAGSGFLAALKADALQGGNLMIPIVLPRIWANVEKGNSPYKDKAPYKVKAKFDQPFPFYPWVILGGCTWSNTIPRQSYLCTTENYSDNGQKDVNLNKIFAKVYDAVLHNKTDYLQNTKEEETLSITAPMAKVLGTSSPAFEEIDFGGKKLGDRLCFLDDDGNPSLPYWEISTNVPEGSNLRVDVVFYNAAIPQ